MPVGGSSQKKDAYSQSVHFVNEKGAKMSNLANGGGLPIRCVLGEEVDPGKNSQIQVIGNMDEFKPGCKSFQ